jgi:hypothetical protein
MYFKYVKERENFDTIKIDDGFAIYRKEGDCLFVRDIWTENRKSMTFLKLYKRLEELGKEEGCKHMEGHVYTQTNNPTLSLKAILSAGFKVTHADIGRIILTKEI